MIIMVNVIKKLIDDYDRERCLEILAD